MAHNRSNSTTATAASRRQSLFIKFVILYAAALTFLSVFQAGRQLTVITPEVETQLLQSTAGNSQKASSSSTTTTTTTIGWDPLNPLAIPPGKAPNLPSVRVENNNNVDTKRKFYGGTGDKKHLGGFTEMDNHGISPTVWRFLIEKLGVHSFLDIGCGRGISTLWFLTHGADVLCAEGSHDAVEKSMLPDSDQQIVEHDFSRGPWWPEKTYDAAWAVEFLEHVGVQYQFNYVSAFRKAALLFVTSSRNGGWHHVEVHMDDWWIRKYESYGFRYSPELTKQVRDTAMKEKSEKKIAPNGQPYNAQHIWLTMKVFVNPMVAALPQHAHLFPEMGCYDGRNSEGMIHRKCGTGKDGALETPLAEAFHPLKLTPEMDAEWERIVKSNLNVQKS